MSGNWTADSSTVTADSGVFTADVGQPAAPAVQTPIPGVIADLFHWWGNDIASDNSGDLLTVQSTVRGQQRVLRRLLTNPGDYRWHPEYGGGLPQYIGKAIDAKRIAAVIRSQLALEAAVAKSPPAQVSVQQSVDDPSAFTVGLSYTDAQNGTPVVLNFSVSA